MGGASVLRGNVNAGKFWAERVERKSVMSNGLAAVAGGCATRRRPSGPRCGAGVPTPRERASHRHTSLRSPGTLIVSTFYEPLEGRTLLSAAFDVTGLSALRADPQ